MIVPWLAHKEMKQAGTNTGLMFFKNICGPGFLFPKALLCCRSRSHVTPQRLSAPALRIMYSFLTISKYKKGKLGGVSVAGVSVAQET